MPRMNGLEATKRIKEAFPDIAVIGLSIQRAGDCQFLDREQLLFHTQFFLPVTFSTLLTIQVRDECGKYPA